jgi:DNA-binding NarL/FixJ family response regulator
MGRPTPRDRNWRVAWIAAVIAIVGPGVLLLGLTDLPLPPRTCRFSTHLRQARGRPYPGEDASDVSPGVTLAVGPGLLSELAARSLRPESGIRFVGQARDEEELDRLMSGRRARVLLLDSETIGADWTGWISRLRRSAPNTRILVVSDGPTQTLVTAALRAGASGVVGKHHDFETFRTAVRRVAAGEIWADRRILGPVMEDLSRSPRVLDGLTPRERQVADCVLLGLRNKEIARRLSISEKTVKSHLYSMYRKMRVDSRFGLFTRMQPKS